jgi:hypothetical protein
MRGISSSSLALALTLAILAGAAGAQNVTLQLTPITYPIQLPDSGGTFDYLLFVTNQDSTPITATVWCMVTLPNNSSWGPAVGPSTQTLAVGQTLGYYRNQNVPPRAAYGYYMFHAYVGVYPDTIWAEDQFEFQKQDVSGTEQLWVATYNGPGNGDDHAYQVAVDAAGNVYVTGRCWGIGSQWDYGTIKYDASGYQIWAASYNGSGNGMDGAHALAIDEDGNVYVTGISEGNGTDEDFATVKYGPSGNQLWVARYDGPQGYDYGEALAVDASGNVYVTGGSRGIGTDYDYTTIKYDANGNQVWLVRYDGPGNYSDCPMALALDGAGNVYVTGYSASSLSAVTWDYATVKYDALGNQLWVARYNGPGNVEDLAYALALDSYGHVCVTGQSIGSGGDWDYATIQYDDSGNQLWVARFAGPGTSQDMVNDLAVDGSGNVYVTGRSYFAGNEEDYMTVKYNSSGNQIWVAQYDSPTHDSDEATSLEVDGGGNVYVTGQSSGYGTSADYATVRYDANGNQIWVAQFNGPGNGIDGAWSVALDGGGNVYVTGSCMDIGNNDDYVTIKYSSGNIANWMPVEAMVLGQPLPQECRLEGNFPNPFNASTVLGYQLPVAGKVSLQIYDTAGRLVTTLVDGWRSAGMHELTWDASGLPSGMYLAKMQAGGYSASGKMVLVK